MSDLVQWTIAMAVVAIAVAGLFVSLRKNRGDTDCGDCPLVETCKKPQKRKMHGKRNFFHKFLAKAKK